jgi:N-acetylneuraminic acid mutarotase
LTSVIINAALHDLGYYLDRYGFAALETVSPSMQENVRVIIRARNQKLPVGKRMANLNEDFTVWKVCKRVLQLEGLYPLYLISIGGFVGEQLVNRVMSLDLVTMRYTTLTPMIYLRHSHASAVLDGKLFVMGGSNYGILSNVECLDLETGQWSEMAPMITPRFAHQAAVLDGKIYVAGGSRGRNGSCPLVESFDAATNQRTPETPMNTPRCFHGLVSAHGKLFAVGGYNFQDRCLSSVECFDPSTRVWSNIAALSTARDDLAVAVLGDRLYAIGGRDSQYQELSSVECLDLSVPNSEWTTVTPMTTPRFGMEAVVTGGKIYIAGGYGLRSIECFDPTVGPAGRWTVVSETSQFCNHAGLLVC